MDFYFPYSVFKLGLVLNGISGMTTGSHVNFTCNPYFELAGRDRLYCVERTWETSLPECRMVKQVCRKQPPRVFNQAHLKAVSRVEFKYELSYVNSEIINNFQTATYVCPPGLVFKNQAEVFYKYFGTQLQAYKNATCIGLEKWDEIPNCI
jgi:hypothetical protein